MSGGGGTGSCSSREVMSAVYSQQQLQPVANLLHCSNDISKRKLRKIFNNSNSNQDDDDDSSLDITADSEVSKITPNQYVKLNVGGSLHYTTMGTLTKEDNMLRAMFSGRMVVLSDKEGWVLIDRCGKHFGKILNFLRDGSIPLPDLRCELAELLCEAKYYLVQGLVQQCEVLMEKRAVDIDPICRVPVITSKDEEQEIVRKSKKPIVKFLYNRGNNKYSYTNSSDDNMLKNIELFDKLSLSFNGRILFIKDIVGDEICVWSFYGHQRKVAEICCTSIVYATEKKQTKVEFPEARIYEECLNILLFEVDKSSSSTAAASHTNHHHRAVDNHGGCGGGGGNGGEGGNGGSGDHHHHHHHNCQSDNDELVDQQQQQQQENNSQQVAAARAGQHRVRRIHVNSNRPV